ncbi:hypothetical protein WDU94_006711 [Cyamophila willieti]
MSEEVEFEEIGEEEGGEEEELLEESESSFDEYDQVESILEVVKQIKHNENLQKQIECEDAEHEDLANKLEKKQKIIQTETQNAIAKKAKDMRECAAKLQVFKCQKYCDEVNLRNNLGEQLERNETLRLAMNLMVMPGLDQNKYNDYHKLVTDEVGLYCQESLRMIKKQDQEVKKIFEQFDNIHVVEKSNRTSVLVEPLHNANEIMKNVMGYFDEQMKKRKQYVSVIEENEKAIQHYTNVLENIKKPAPPLVSCKKEQPMKVVLPRQKMNMVLKRENEFKCLKNEIHALEMKLIKLEQIEDHALDTLNDLRQE